MKANNEKYTVLYGRLSQEDDREGESNSISNQRMILEKYAEEKGFENIKFLFDDGYSGTSYNRPAWNEIHYRDIGMLNDVNPEFDIISLEKINADGLEIVWDDELLQVI